jgi:hypothetical protein
MKRYLTKTNLTWAVIGLAIWAVLDVLPMKVTDGLWVVICLNGVVGTAIKLRRTLAAFNHPMYFLLLVEEAGAGKKLYLKKREVVLMHGAVILLCAACGVVWAVRLFR